jgi:hypothetical protein
MRTCRDLLVPSPPTHEEKRVRRGKAWPGKTEQKNKSKQALGRTDQNRWEQEPKSQPDQPRKCKATTSEPTGGGKMSASSWDRKIRREGRENQRRKSGARLGREPATGGERLALQKTTSRKLGSTQSLTKNQHQNRTRQQKPAATKIDLCGKSGPRHLVASGESNCAKIREKIGASSAGASPRARNEETRSKLSGADLRAGNKESEQKKSCATANGIETRARFLPTKTVGGDRPRARTQMKTTENKGRNLQQK